MNLYDIEEEFPFLNQMLGCYFNEDFKDFYLDVKTAFSTYCTESEPLDKKELILEIEKLLAQPDRVQEVIHKLGSRNIDVPDLHAWLSSMASTLRRFHDQSIQEQS